MSPSSPKSSLPSEQPPAASTAVRAHRHPRHTSADYERVEDGRLAREPEELPRRPRRRLLGTGGNPIFLALLGVLLIACGFIGGVLVEKGQTSSSSSAGCAAASLASRLRALRGGTRRSRLGGCRRGWTSAGAEQRASPDRPPEPSPTSPADTLYVTNAEGNTVKVTTSAATSVTKTVKSSVKGIHPGETVTVTGATGAGGAVSAESISVGAAGGGPGRAVRRRRRRHRRTAQARGTGSGGGEPSLFGGGWLATVRDRSDQRRTGGQRITTTRSPTKEVHASHQQQTAAGPQSRRSLLVARQPRAGGVRRLLEQLLHHDRERQRERHDADHRRSAAERSGGRFAALRECLKKNGITLPTAHTRPAPRRAPAASSAARGPGAAQGRHAKRSTKPPSRSAAALLARRPSGGRGPWLQQLRRPNRRSRSSRRACAENGVNVPEPNTSGKGPIFNTKGIDTNSAKFKAAEAKCRSDLLGAFARGQANGGAPGAGAAPGAAPATRLATTYRSAQS